MPAGGNFKYAGKVKNNREERTSDVIDMKFYRFD